MFPALRAEFDNLGEWLSGRSNEIIIGAVLYFLIGFCMWYYADLKWNRNRDMATMPTWCGIGWPIVLLALGLFFAITVVFVIVTWPFDQLIPYLDEWVAIRERKLQHSDDAGELWAASVRGKRYQWVRVKDSTGDHWLSVPDQMRSVKEAVAWTYGLHEYAPTARV